VHQIKRVLKGDKPTFPLNSIVEFTVLMPLQVSSLDDIAHDEPFAEEFCHVRAPTFARGEKEQVLLCTFEETYDVLLVAPDAIVLGILLDMRFRLFIMSLFAQYISNRQLRRRRVIKEM
jgi:hypothetical protein